MNLHPSLIYSLQYNYSLYPLIWINPIFLDFRVRHPNTINYHNNLLQLQERFLSD